MALAALAAAACAPPAPEKPADPALAFLMERHDGNGDGKITAGEYGRDEAAFARLDRDGNGILDAADLERLRQERAKVRGSGRGREGRARVAGADHRPLLGLTAPDLVLPRLAGGAPERLSDLWKERPVLLVFGSWT
ncbi:MAG: hypothetical protein ISQ08_10425 [Planctomycetes bacterium]|nr:hypothetical protein [Planctomycetota bacterium]